jgi:hypothetical protein
MLHPLRWLSAIYAILVALSCWACGSDDENASSGSGGDGGASGAVACQLGSMDSVIQDMVDEPCATADEECSSNNGCGGCSVTCRNGTWEPTDGGLCYSVGGSC